MYGGFDTTAEMNLMDTSDHDTPNEMTILEIYNMAQHSTTGTQLDQCFCPLLGTRLIRYTITGHTKKAY